MQETSRFNLRVKSYDFFSSYKSADNPDSIHEMPTFYKEQQYGITRGIFRKKQKEIGYLKMRFFDSISIFKPAVTVMVFDWSLANPISFDLAVHEQIILNELKVF